MGAVARPTAQGVVKVNMESASTGPTGQPSVLAKAVPCSVHRESTPLSIHTLHPHLGHGPGSARAFPVFKGLMVGGHVPEGPQLVRAPVGLGQVF